MNQPLTDRLCGQPVSWGINYLPGWGVQLDAEQVLGDMQRAGLTATEYQPGLFPPNPDDAKALFSKHSLRCVGGWVPLVFHGRDIQDVLAEFRSAAGFIRALGGEIATIAADLPGGDFQTSSALTDTEWDQVLTGLDAVSAAGREYGLRCVLHPHVGTVVEGPRDIDRVLRGSTIDFCLDIGHIWCGGGDPVKIAADLGERIGHVHLKDVRGSLAKKMITGELSWADGVAQGVFQPLGRGDVNFPAIFDILDSTGYQGWYVIEQDKRLTNTSHPPLRDVEDSVQFLRTLLASRRSN